MTTDERILMPTEPFRARLRIARAGGGMDRYGRTEITVSADQSTIAAVRDGQPLEAAAIASVANIGQKSWQVTTLDGDTWGVIGAGCNCGGG